MPCFDDSLACLKTKNEVAANVSASAAHRATQEHIDRMAALEAAKLERDREQVASTIATFFNGISATASVAPVTSRNVFVGALPEAEIEELITVLTTTKGYTVVRDGPMISISL
jgi:hypothetical protein